ncbi:MAG: acyl-CoA thioesterase [Bdellovibrionales bacterium]|nr:acyl-CoA thioesterase [Bdellovibrionales bacterium]
MDGIKELKKDKSTGFAPFGRKRGPTGRSPREGAFLTRKIVAPDMLNPNGTLFGGVIMSWIDEVAFMSARRHSGRPFVVTASIDNITFWMPLKPGEHVILTSQVNYVGRTSMEIGVKVERENPYDGSRTQATSAYLTFVALDKRGRPTSVPPLILETPEDERRHEEARIRVKVRERIRSRLKRKYGLAAEGKEAAKPQSPSRSSSAPTALWSVLSPDAVMGKVKDTLKRLQGSG